MFLILFFNFCFVEKKMCVKDVWLLFWINFCPYSVLFVSFWLCFSSKFKSLKRLGWLFLSLRNSGSMNIQTCQYHRPCASLTTAACASLNAEKALYLRCHWSALHVRTPENSWLVLCHLVTWSMMQTWCNELAKQHIALSI